MRNGKCTREFALVPSYTVTIDFHPESCWKTEYGKCTHSPRWVHNKTIAQAFVLTLGLSFCRIALSFCFWVQMYFGVAASILWVFKEQWYLFSYHCSLCSFLFVYEFHTAASPPWRMVRPSNGSPLRRTAGTPSWSMLRWGGCPGSIRRSSDEHI